MVAPGDVLAVALQPGAGVAVSSMLVVSPAGAAVLAPPFVLDIQVPADFVGPFTGRP